MAASQDERAQPQEEESARAQDEGVHPQDQSARPQDEGAQPRDGGAQCPVAEQAAPEVATRSAKKSFASSRKEVIASNLQTKGEKLARQYTFVALTALCVGIACLVSHVSTDGSCSGSPVTPKVWFLFMGLNALFACIVFFLSCYAMTRVFRSNQASGVRTGEQADRCLIETCCICLWHCLSHCLSFCLISICAAATGRAAATGGGAMCSSHGPGSDVEAPAQSGGNERGALQPDALSMVILTYSTILIVISSVVSFVWSIVGFVSAMDPDEADFQTCATSRMSILFISIAALVQSCCCQCCAVADLNHLQRSGRGAKREAEGPAEGQAECPAEEQADGEAEGHADGQEDVVEGEVMVVV